jgi:hypothetical protein
MKSRDRAWAVLVLLVLAVAGPAHDGGFGHSRRTIYVAPGPGGLTLEYRILHNRDDALLEMTRMDADGDGKVSAEEKERYFGERGRQLAEKFLCRTAGGEALQLRFVRYELGQALTQVYHFALATSEKEVLLDDRNFPHKPGLVQVRHAPGLAVELARPVDLTHAERVNLRVKRVMPQPQE